MAEEHDDDLELGDLRSVFKSMRDADEDPPANGMAALMAAARAKADEMKPQPSWWQRVTSTLLRPPVLAFATVVVLVGGGAVMMRHRSEMKETANVALPSSSNEKRDDTFAPVIAAPEAAKEEAAPVRTTTALPEKPTVKQSRPLNDEQPAKDAEPKTDSASSAKKKGEAHSVKSAVRSTGETEKGLDAPLDDAMNITREGQSDGPRGQKQPVTPKIAVAHGSVAPTASRDAEGVGGMRQAQVSVADLVKQWEAAAAANNCALANSLGAQLAERDQALYIRTFQNNPALQTCFKQ